MKTLTVIDNRKIVISKAIIEELGLGIGNTVTIIQTHKDQHKNKYRIGVCDGYKYGELLHRDTDSGEYFIFAPYAAMIIRRFSNAGIIHLKHKEEIPLNGSKMLLCVSDNLKEE